MQIISEIEQGSADWLAVRLGIATASEFDCLLVSGKGEAGFGAAAFSYMNQLIGERITGEAAELPFTTRATERGHELEAVARDLYESREEVTAENVGIILNHGAGYSPDALIGSSGLIEIKTKLPKFQVDVILADEIPKEHIAQCQGGLWLAEREWIDFMNLGVSKGSGVAHLCRELGIGLADAAAVGDTYNDIPMLSAVGHSFVVANAEKHMHAHADYLVPSNDNRGVATLIDAILAAKGR